MNEMYVPLGMCFDVVVNDKLLMTSELPLNNQGVPEIGNVTNLVDDVIGTGNYDVGIWIAHREKSDENTGISVGNGAYSTTTKANGYAKADKWVVAHEVGHLFGADHTTQGEGSLMDNAGEFFSYPSIKKIRNAAFENGAGNAYRTEKVANNAPQFTAQMKETYRIPQGACLSIPVYASDADGHSLRYTAIGCSSTTVVDIVEDGTMPHFYSFKPQTSNIIEYSPIYTEDVNGDYLPVEGTDIPSMYAGSYSIAILVNDMPGENSYDYLTSNPFYSNYAVWDANVEIVRGTPFTASISPAQNSYTAGSTVTVNWGVNENHFTNNSRVRITMSTDYGKTFSHVLADDVPALDGSKVVTLPNVNVGNVDVDFSTRYVSAVRSMRGGIIRVEEIDGAAFTLTTLTPENGGGFNITGGATPDPTSTYTISVSFSEGGWAYISGGNATDMETQRVAGEQVTLCAEASDGYEFANWTLGGVQVSTNSNYTITVTGNAEYVANFKKKPVTYTITAIANPVKGGTATVNGESSIRIEENGSVTLLAIPEKGYEFVNWTNGGKEVTTYSEYTINNVAGDAEYVANFKEEGAGIPDLDPSTGLGGKWYRIKDNASGKYIDINKEGKSENSHGNVIMSDRDEKSERQIIYFETSGDGYKLMAATGDYIKCETWNVSAGDASSAATLLFEEIGDNYYIKWYHTDYNNNIRYFKVENAEGGDYALHPYDDAADKSTAAIWTLEEVKYTLSVSANSGGTAKVATGGGEGAASVEVSYNSSATLTATPASGYSFVNWTMEGITVSTDAEYTVSNIKADAEYVANFERNLNGHWFRLKSNGQYMHVKNHDTHKNGSCGGVNMVKDKTLNSYDEVFTFEKSGKDYKLKTRDGYYINCAHWNVDANSTSDGTTLIFEENGDNYLIKWYNIHTSPNDYKYFKVGPDNGNTGDYPYCDADKSAAATWTLEPVTLCDITVEAEGGTFAATVNGVEMGASFTVENGTEVTVTAIANDDYSFMGWYDGENKVYDKDEYTFTASSTVSLIARFGDAYDGKWFRIKDYNSGYYMNVGTLWHSSHGNVNMVSLDEGSADQIFYFKQNGDGYCLSSLSGHNINCEQWNVDAYDDKEATVLLFDESNDGYIIRWNNTYVTNGYFKVENAKEGDKQLHPFCDAEESKAATWILEEVTDFAGIHFDVTMNATFSSLYLAYCAIVPEGVEAYNATGIDNGYVTLEKIADSGETIPAKTPVILYREDDEKIKIFYHSSEEVEKSNDYTTLLGGRLYTQYVKCDDNADYYKLMIKNGEAKMYLMYKEFNAEGVSQGANHTGGHIKCSANKIYMRVPEGKQMAMFGMRFATPGATDIEEVEIGNEKDEIYDLSGRKLTEITGPGFYIVNGKRVFIK